MVEIWNFSRHPINEDTPMLCIGELHSKLDTGVAIKYKLSLSASSKLVRVDKIAGTVEAMSLSFSPISFKVSLRSS